MAEIQDWQRQSMRKVGSASGPNSMHPKLGGAKLHMADGGSVDEAADKQRGLESSQGDSVGLWERLKAGNIDEPGSEAYNRWGAGKARGDDAQLLRESRRTSPASPDAAIQSAAADAVQSEADPDLARESRRTTPPSPAPVAAAKPSAAKTVRPAPDASSADPEPDSGYYRAAAASRLAHRTIKPAPTAKAARPAIRTLAPAGADEQKPDFGYDLRTVMPGRPR